MSKVAYLKDCIEEFIKCCKIDWAEPSVGQFVFWLRKQGYDIVMNSREYDNLIIKTKEEYHNDLTNSYDTGFKVAKEEYHSDLKDAYDSGLKVANLLTKIKLEMLLSEYKE